MQSTHGTHGVQTAQTADGAWHRVHPISPLVRGWLVLAGLLFFFIQSAGEDVVQVLFEGGQFRAARGLGISLAIFGGIFVLALIAFFLSWRFTRYRLTPETVQLHTGIIFRQRREVRLDRVQAVDLRQPLLARIVGLAELKFEAADGGSSAMALEFIKRDEAEALRREIMGRASGIQSGVDPDVAADPQARAVAGPSDPADPSGHPHPDDGRDLALEGDGAVVGQVGKGRSGLPEAPEQVMLQVPAGRLIGSVLLGTGMTTLVVAVLSLGVVLGVIWWFNGQELPPEATRGVLLGSIPVAISSVGAVWSQFNSGYNFTVATASDGLRL
ncbi:PH domain-containing protein, partial [Micrococcus terreus]|uniref:PH domain-containing protein n=1 Tax=Micrococcus terreus TaxID=574650 RepID=UPI0023F9B027